MSTAIDVAKEYFRASNESDLSAIRDMMIASTTYSSITTGVYLGVDQIIEMQDAFHSSFEWLNWEVLEAKEVRPGVVWLDFILTGKKKDGTEINAPGEEYVLEYQGKIQHVEVRHKG